MNDDDSSSTDPAGLRSGLDMLEGLVAAGVPPEAIAAYVAIVVIFGHHHDIHDGSHANLLDKARKAIVKGAGFDTSNAGDATIIREPHSIERGPLASFSNTFRGLIQWNRLALHSSKHLLGELDLDRVAKAAPDLANLLRSGELQGLLDVLDSNIAEIADDGGADDHLFFAVDSVHFVATGHAFVALRDVIAPSIIGDGATLEARNRLATRIGDETRRFQEEAIRPRLADKAVSPDTQENGILFLDELFARHLESIGEHGTRAAADVREKGKSRTAETRWVLWKKPNADDSLGAPWVAVLGRALWRDELGPELERERRAIAGATQPVVRFLADVTRRGNVAHRDTNRQIDLLLDRDERPIAEFSSSVYTAGVALLTLERLQAEASLLATAEAIALVHYLAAAARRHHIEYGDFVEEIKGGYEELARRLGFARDGRVHPDTTKRLRQIVRVLQLVRGDFRGIAIEGIVTSVYDNARGQRKAVLRLAIGDPMRPGFVHFLEDRLGATAPSARDARMVVPLVGLPPLFGRNNDRALQANAALELSILLRLRAEELAARGSAHVPRSDWERIADRAGYARRYLGRTVDALIEHWAKPGGENNAPAFIEAGDGWRFNLGPDHVEARRALAEAGARTTRRRREGQASAASRASDAPRRRRRK